MDISNRIFNYYVNKFEFTKLMAKKDIISSRSTLTVVKHNKIVDAGYSMTIYEQRVLLSCIAKIDSTKALDDSHIFEVSVDDIADLIDLRKDAVYEHLKQTCDKLFKREILIELQGKNEKIRTLKTRWVYGIGYVENEGKIQLRFTPEIMPYLTQISRDFTQYKLSNILKFKCNYSIRLYELICRWMNAEHTVDLVWLKDKFQLNDKYPVLADFKKRVIDPAIAEINLHSDMNISYAQIKTGREVTAFKFSYSPKVEKTKISNQNSQYSTFLNPKKSKSATAQSKSSSKNKEDSVNNVDYFADMRQKFGDLLPIDTIPQEIIDELKNSGRW
jgi:plasmid replication initiation protein